jgi:hypothetical protein
LRVVTGERTMSVGGMKVRTLKKGGRMPRPRTAGASRTAAATVVALGVLLVTAGSAQAARPDITQAPAITGQAYIDAQLKSSAGAWRNGGDAYYYWQRCHNGCREWRWIEDAEGLTYTLRADDEGRRVRVVLFVVNRDGWDWAASQPTGFVTEPPPTPPPPPPPPEPEPEPSPQPPTPPAPVTPAPPAAPTVESTEPAAPAGDVLSGGAQLLRPFPSVALRGVLTRRGARFTRISVVAPEGARIRVRCSGPSCPRERWARAASVTRLRPFERSLRAGTRIAISVTRSGFIGKHTLIVVRRGKPPLRRDRCLNPGARRATVCPAG